jgi:hypothetical protein
MEGHNLLASELYGFNALCPACIIINRCCHLWRYGRLLDAEVASSNLAIPTNKISGLKKYQ